MNTPTRAARRTGLRPRVLVLLRAGAGVAGAAAVSFAFWAWMRVDSVLALLALVSFCQ